MIETIEFETIDSTNETAKRLLSFGRKSSVAIISKKQTNGKGQYGRVWESSSSDGLYYSLLLKGSRFPKDLSGAENRVIVSNIQNIISLISGEKTEFKEPNDIYLDDKKLGGVLIESFPNHKNEYCDAVIIGIGLNINQKEFSGELEKKAISLYQKTGKIFNKYKFVGLLNEYLSLQFN
ncbi:biotin--[acetyl-CoA-carboxylase] ligase [Candidatus Marinamargulisbacteria bacterium SCGC AG-343-K17]|nr:biotin--[acetyl-CoA-carboxylase] ligase [Candidatus Marinamargulisbacteria bacterium SCGC AG-343-K17]